MTSGNAEVDDGEAEVDDREAEDDDREAEDGLDVLQTRMAHGAYQGEAISS